MNKPNTTPSRKLLAAALAASASISALAPVAHASLLVEENFAYAAGALSGSNGGTGFTSAWTATSAFTVNSSGLSYSGLQSTGGSMTVVGAGNWSSSARRDFTTIDNTTGIVWGSYLVRPDVIGDDGFEVKYGEPGNINYGNATGFGNGGGTDLKLDTNSNSGTNYGPALVVGSTSLIVWAFNAGPDDGDFLNGDFVLFVNPTVGVAPDLLAPDVYKYAGSNPLANMGIMQVFARNVTATVDELRIGNSYADVTPEIVAVPEPSTYAAMAGAIGLISAIFSRRRRAAR